MYNFVSTIRFIMKNSFVMREYDITNFTVNNILHICSCGIFGDSNYNNRYISIRINDDDKNAIYRLYCNNKNNNKIYFKNCERLTRNEIQLNEYYVGCIADMLSSFKSQKIKYVHIPHLFGFADFKFDTSKNAVLENCILCFIKSCFVFEYANVFDASKIGLPYNMFIDDFAAMKKYMEIEHPTPNKKTEITQKNIEFIEPITLVNYSPPINVFGKKEDIVCNILSDLKRKRDIDNDIELLNNIKHIRYNDITSVKNILS